MLRTILQTIAAADAANVAQEFSVLDDPIIIVRGQSLPAGVHTASVTSHVDPDEMTVTDFDDSTEDALGLPDSSWHVPQRMPSKDTAISTQSARQPRRVAFSDSVEVIRFSVNATTETDWGAGAPADTPAEKEAFSQPLFANSGETPGKVAETETTTRSLRDKLRQAIAELQTVADLDGAPSMDTTLALMKTELAQAEIVCMDG